MRPKLGPGEKGARERLVDAFWERARVRPVSEITVDELCAAVGCRRSTFYYHFGGIDELRRSALERTELPALLAAEMHRAVVPALAEAIAGVSPSERCE